MQRSTQHPRRRAWLRRLIVVAVLAAAVGALLSQTVFAQTSYIITDGNRVTVHRSYSSDPYEVLTEAGIELEEEDTYETGYADGHESDHRPPHADGHGHQPRRAERHRHLWRNSRLLLARMGITRARATRSRAAARRRPTTA